MSNNGRVHPKHSNNHNRTTKPTGDVGYTPMRRKEFTTIFLRRMESEWVDLIDLMIRQAHQGNTKVLLYLVDYCLTPPALWEAEQPVAINSLQDARNLGKERLESLLNTFIIEMH